MDGYVKGGLTQFWQLLTVILCASRDVERDQHRYLTSFGLKLKVAKMMIFCPHEPRTQVAACFHFGKFQRILILRRRPMQVKCRHFRELENPLLNMRFLSMQWKLTYEL